MRKGGKNIEVKINEEMIRKTIREERKERKGEREKERKRRKEWEEARKRGRKRERRESKERQNKQTQLKLIEAFRNKEEAIRSHKKEALM